jgi:hypothetical protein
MCLVLVLFYGGGSYIVALFMLPIIIVLVTNVEMYVFLKIKWFKLQWAI